MRMTAAAALLGSAALLAGCGNAVDATPLAGLTGMTVTRDGHHVVEAYVCRDEIDTISIVLDRTGLAADEENVAVRTYRTNLPLTGLVTLDLDAPSSDWENRTPTRFAVDKGYVITGEGSGKDGNETQQLNLDDGGLKSLRPGSVFVSSATGDELTAYTPAQFKAAAEKICAADD